MNKRNTENWISRIYELAEAGGCVVSKQLLFQTARREGPDSLNALCEAVDKVTGHRINDRNDRITVTYDGPFIPQRNADGNIVAYVLNAQNDGEEFETTIVNEIADHVGVDHSEVFRLFTVGPTVSGNNEKKIGRIGKIFRTILTL